MPDKKIHFPKLKKSLLQLIGPSIIFVALSLNGGELLLWPSLAANYSLKLLWAVPIILFLQFFINMEIERYSLVTGKSVEKNLVGKVKWLAYVFAATVLLTLVWPAWMTTAGNLFATIIFSKTYSQDQIRTIGLVITIFLMISTYIVFKSRKTYATLEKFSQIGLIISLAIIIFVVAINFRLDYLIEGFKGFLAWGYIPKDMPRFDFLGALAFGGVAGVLNLVQSEWVIEKGYGVASLSQDKRDKIDYKSKETRSNFLHWFKMVNKEHFFLFFCANIFSIFLLTYLGRILLPLGTAQGFGVLAAEISILNAKFTLLGTLFGISGILIFIMANVVILDVIGRLSYQLLDPVIKSGKLKKLHSSNISMIAAVLGIVILLLSVIFPNFKQPYFLLVIAASLSAMTMWLYPPLLLKMNIKLPKVVRPSAFRIVMVLTATFFYGLFSLWALATFLPMVVVVIIGLLITSYQVNFLIRG